MTADAAPVLTVNGRQHTPSDTKGILSNGNVKLDERLDLLDFLEVENVAPVMESRSSSSASDASTVVGVSVLPSSGAVSWGASASGAVDRATPQRPVYASALAVAIDAERRGALSSLEDDIPPMAPWWLQATFCLCARHAHLRTCDRHDIGTRAPCSAVASRVSRVCACTRLTVSRASCPLPRLRAQSSVVSAWSRPCGRRARCSLTSRGQRRSTH